MSNLLLCWCREGFLVNGMPAYPVEYVLTAAIFQLTGKNSNFHYSKKKKPKTKLRCRILQGEYEISK